MFWNDIKIIKADVLQIRHSQAHLATLLQQMSQRVPMLCKGLEKQECCSGTMTEENEGQCGFSRIENIEQDIREIKESFDSLFDYTSEVSTINLLHEKLDQILDDENRLKKVQLSVTVCEKFDDYMKNVEKLHSLVNEVKGCASMSRAAMHENKIEGFISALDKSMRGVIESQEKDFDVVFDILENIQDEMNAIKNNIKASKKKIASKKTKKVVSNLKLPS